MGARRPTLDVVAAVIEEDGRILVTQRPAGSPLAGLWEFPGGKIEPGETPEAALARELAEELAIEVEVGPLRHDVTHAYADRTVRLRFYDCRRTAGTPRNAGVADHRWVAPADLATLPFPEADRELVAALAGA